MITFGYKNKFSGALRAVAAIVVGLLMLVSSSWLRMCVMVVGAFLIASGIYSLVLGIVGLRRNKENRYRYVLLLVNAGVDLAIGLAMLFFAPGLAAVITTTVMMIFTILLILLVLWQGIVLFGGLAMMGARRTLLVMPAIVLVFTLVLLFLPKDGHLFSILVGAALVVYGVSELISSWKIEKAKEAYRIKFPDKVAEKEKGPDVEDIARDVEYEKVDDQGPQQ